MRKITTMLLTFMVGLSMALGTAAPASAAPAITRLEYTVGYDAIYRNGVVSLSEYIPPSTQAYLTIAACGRVLHTQTFQGVTEIPATEGYPAEYLLFFSKIIDRSMAGPTIDFSVSFSDPALPPTAGTFYTHTGFPRDCGSLETGGGGTGGTGDDKLVIQKWSKKKKSFSKAMVGKKLAVTATKANGAKKTYTWFAGSKRLKAGRSIRVQKSMVGKTMKMKVTVFKGNQTKRKTLNFGRARR